MKSGASLIIVFVLALTAGITAAAVAIVSSYLWRPLPYRFAERLVVADYPRSGPSIRALAGIDAASTDVFADLALASDPDSFTVIGGRTPFTTDGRWIGADVFPMFGIAPVVGRVFTRAEADSGAAVALLGFDVWRDQFGASRDVVGKAITLRATLRRGAPETVTIVGVLPPRFWHVEDRTGLLVPLPRTRAPWLMRLRGGVSRGDAARQMSGIVRQQLRDVPSDWQVMIQTAQEAHIGRVRPMLTATAWSVLLLAAVTLANLAFLQLARGVSRQREIGIRKAIGAGHVDVVRLFLAEGAIHGAVASLIACAIAFTILTAGIGLIEQYLGRVIPGSPGDELHLYTGLIGGTIAAAMGLSLCALVASRSPVLASALAGTSASTDTPARLLLRQLIVTAQVAVAFCLLVGAALMVRTAWHIGRLDLGFDAANVLSANVTLHQGTYPTLDAQRRFYDALIASVQQLPEVEQAGITGWLPFRVGPAVTVIADERPDAMTSATLQGVDSGYQSALQLRLRQGRFISADDRAGRESAAVISAALARAVWGDHSPLGRVFRIKFSPEPGRGFGPYTVVGVVDDVMQSVVRDTPPQLYLSFHQQPIAANAFLQVRTRVDPLQIAPEVERVTREMDPNIALGSVTTLDALVERDGLRPRLLARALAGIAALAIAIAVVGLYAVSAWIAHLRRREAALRVALGCDQLSVAMLLARRGLLAVAAGLAIGWVAAWPVTTMIASEVRGLEAADLPTRIAVAVLLLLIAVSALAIPAWRASTANLATLLRDA